jgi:hypothetical protein
MIDSKSPKFVEKLQQSLSLSLSLGHSRTTREVWSSKKKLTTKRRWSIQAALILSLNKWWTSNPNKNKTKTFHVFPVLSPYSFLIPKLPNSMSRCDAASSHARKNSCDFLFQPFELEPDTTVFTTQALVPKGTWFQNSPSLEALPSVQIDAIFFSIMLGEYLASTS